MRGRWLLWMCLYPCFAAGCEAPAPACEGCDAAATEVAITSFRARPSVVARFDEVTLSWTSVRATGCALSPLEIAVPRSGELIVTPSESATYALVCEGLEGPAVAEVSVTVAGARDGGPLADGGTPDGGDETIDDGGWGDGGSDEDAGTLGVDGGRPTTSLRHRYRFEDGAASAAVADDVGGAHGQLRGGAYLEGDTLVLESEDGYADLPNGILSSLQSVTIEAWVSWGGANAGYWQRIFDFGTTSVGEIDDVGGSPFSAEQSTFLQLSPAASDGLPRVTVNDGLGAYAFVSAAAPLPVNQWTHMAVSYDASAGELRLYIDGVLEGSTSWTVPLSAIDDVNCWIGRSNYSADPAFVGALDELRVYETALTEAELASSFASGPDILWTPP